MPHEQQQQTTYSLNSVTGNNALNHATSLPSSGTIVVGHQRQQDQPTDCYTNGICYMLFTINITLNFMIVFTRIIFMLFL